MLEKVGLHIVNDGDKVSLRYNGKEIDAVFKGVVNSFGVYVDGARLDIDGTGIALASTAAVLEPQGDNLYFGDVEMLPSGKCINITATDYSLLLQGKLVAGYKRYNPSAVYNIVADVSLAPEITYTIADGVITFSDSTEAAVAENMIFDDYSGDLDENEIDLDDTVTDTACPFVNVRRFDPIVPVGGKIKLDYYVDTQTMSLLKDDTLGDTFTVIVKTAGGSTVKKTTYAGFFSLETPVFSTAGETWFTVECIDSNGVGSIVQYFDILVRDAVTPNYYTMIAEDLTTYGIVTREDDEPIPVNDAISNKAALTAFFAAVKQGGYNGVVMLEKIYWIDYHAVNGIGTQTYYRCVVENNTITFVEQVTEQDVIALGVKTHSTSSVPQVGNKYKTGDNIVDTDYNGNYYRVINTSTAGDDIVFPDEFTVDLNGATIAATQSTDLNGGELVYLNNNFDTHIVNGIIKGNYEGYDFPLSLTRLGVNVAGEHLSATRINASRYCSFERLDVSGSMGYDAAVTASITNLSEPTFTNNTRVNLSTGEIISNATGHVTTNKFSLSLASAMGSMSNKYIALGRTGYCTYFNMGTQRECFVSFYNGDTYISSVKTKLYHLVSVPANATHAIYTCYGKTYNDGNDVDWKNGTKKGILKIFCPKVSRGIVMQNCHWHDTRTTAISYLLAKNVLLEGNSYENIAKERGEYGVTRILGSFEDSWQWLNGVKMSNLSCVKGSGSSTFTVHYAQNLEVTGLSGISFYNSGGIEDGFFEGNNFQTLTIDINNRSYHPHVVYRNNRIGSLVVTYATGSLGSPDQTIPMSGTVITNQCGYSGLKLVNSKNGDTFIDR